MSTKIEPILQTQGFGNDFFLARGYRHAIIEYHRSSGIQKSTGSGFAWQTVGVINHIFDFNSVIGTNDTPRSLIISQGRSFSTQQLQNYVYASTASGNIIQTANGIVGNNLAEYIHQISNNHNYFSNFIVDPKGRNLYAQDRYLGMVDPNAGSNYIIGTVAVTNGSASVVGTGTIFTSAMVGKAFRVAGDNTFYLVSTYTDATHITLNSNYAGTTASGKSYIINTQWNDSWKDFGGSVPLIVGSPANCPMDTYEDTVLFGRGNNICTLNVTTDTITTDALPALNFPDGYSIDHIVSNSNGILIGINTSNGKSFVALWDNYSTRSIAPWIWFEDKLFSIAKIDGDWIIITSKGIYTSNGYTVRLIKSNFLNMTSGDIINNYPKNSIVIDNALYFGGISLRGSKRRAVVYKYDMGTNLVEAIPRANLNQTRTKFIQFEYSANLNYLYTLVDGVTDNGVDFYLERFAPKCSNFISTVVGNGDDNKLANRIRLKVRKSNIVPNGYLDAFTFTIAVKISGNNRPMYGWQTVKTTSTAKNTITVDNSSGSYTTPEIGDEVEFTGDNYSNNNAGYSRNIISITGNGTATEVWTVDSNFPDLPQANQEIVLTPFRLVKRYAMSVANGKIEPLVFLIQNEPKGRNFFIKIDIEDNTSGIPLEFDDIDFHYDDLGQME